MSESNTLATPSRADYFCFCSSIDDVREALSWAKKNDQPAHILGGGSNTLLNERVEGLVIKPDFSGWQLDSEDGNTVILRVGAGENWHQFVRMCVNEGWSGLENLAFIPGTVGAAPIQNIGAYGVEVASLITRVDTLNLRTGKLQQFNNSACNFTYRDSVFKHPEANCHLVYQVYFRLQKRFQALLDYPALRDAFEGRVPETAMEVADKVEQVRRRKLPDPNAIPNAGSFFKNPIVPLATFGKLLETYPDMVAYPFGDAHKKIAAAWLIDRCGWKQRSLDGVSVHSEQALVVVNPERQPLETVMRFAEAISADVYSRFGVKLELEPQGLQPITST